MHGIMRRTGIRKAKALPYGLQLLGSINHTAEHAILEITAPTADITQAIADGTYESRACARLLTMPSEQTSQGTDCGDAPSHCCDSPYCALHKFRQMDLQLFT